MATVDVYIDGSNVTQYILDGSVTHRLNRPAVCEISFPSTVVSIGGQSKIKIVLNGALDFHGTVEGESAIEIDGAEDPDSIITKAQAIDPLVYLDTRRAMDSDGDYSNPAFMYEFTNGPSILEEIVSNTISNIGPLPFGLGTVVSGSADVSGAPTNFPMMISEVMILLTDTGECDIEMVPIDSGGQMGTLNIYPGNMGNDLTGSVHFQYQTGTYNCTGCRLTVDKSQLANRIRYLLGPRRETAADPKGLQHWDGSIDRTTGTEDPPIHTFPANWVSIGEPARAQSEDDYGIREDTVIIDAQGNSSRDPEDAAVLLPRELYLFRWCREAWIRLKPKLMVHLTPQPGTLPIFKVGDLINVSCGSSFNGGFSGEQRVMEYTYRWDDRGVVELGAPAGQAGAAAVTVTDIAEGLDL